MTRGAAETFFDAIAGRYERAYALSSDESRRRMRRVLAALPSPPARILDLGVGTGRELSSLLDAGYAPTGLDASRAMLERCSRRARSVPLVRADFWVAPLPFERGTFDGAVALHGTLAHPPDDQAVGHLARELGRVVRAGGIWVIEVPSIRWLDHVEANPLPADRQVRRTSERTCIYEDLVAGASIEASLLDERDWHAALAPDWEACVETVDEFEWLLVARRAPRVP